MQNLINKRNIKATAICLLIAFCYPLLLYLQTLNFGFTDYDDNAIVINNYDFLSNPGNLHKAFLYDAFLLKNHPSQSSSYIGDIFYRPLQTISYMTDIWLSGGNNTWMYHLTNVLLLGLTACLLFLLLRKFRIELKLSLLTTLIYCSHSLFVSTVAWIPARGDMLLMVFSLISFLLFAEFLHNAKVKFLIFSWLTFSLALFCKETAALLPLLFIIYFFTYESKNQIIRKRVLNFLFFAAVLFLISLLTWFWLRSMAIGEISNMKSVGLIPFLKNLQTIPESLAMFFLPVKITPVPAYSFVNTFIGLLIILVIIFQVFRKKEFRKEKIFGLLWFLLLLMPTMLFKNEYVDYLNHRFFLPLIGILMFTFFSIPRKWIEVNGIKTSWIMAFVVVFLFSVTFIQARSYSDPLTFYNSVIAHNQHNALMYNNRGFEYELRKDFQSAINDYSKALELDPDFAVAYFNRGNIFMNIGNADGAIADYNNAILLNPFNADAYINRGNIYYSKANFKMAISDYNKVIALNPGYAFAYNNRGNAYDDMGDHESAIRDFNTVIAMNPYFAIAYYNRGTALKAKGMLKEAEQDFLMYERLTKR